VARPFLRHAAVTWRAEKRRMADIMVLQYLGFTSSALGREYSFVVRDTSGQLREYSVTIANEAFVSHRTRYQDGPDICSLRLRRELAADGADPSVTRFSITDSELSDYKKNDPKTLNHLQKREK
jgi:hypothetical protein